jgi:Protein of unknown function (DUF3570)
MQINKIGKAKNMSTNLPILIGMVCIFLITPSRLQAQTSLTRSKHELLLAQYRDNANQEVSTLEGKTRVTLKPEWSLGFKGLAEWIRVTGNHAVTTHATEHIHEGHGDHDPGGTGMDMDIVTGASIQGHGHHGSGEGRGEGTISLRRDYQSENPASISASLRYSGESDFHSNMATMSGGKEFNQRNTALSGYLGTGLDYSTPKEAPPGQSEKWPATSTRFAGGIQLGQILSPRIHSGLSYALSILSGTLENPYRQARIVTSLFPERLPDFRIRHVFGAELNAYLGLGIGAFHRQGAYFDSWGIAAWIPESAFQIELGEKGMLISRHKYFYQVPADFYQTTYPTLSGWYTGDAKLGPLEGNEFSLGFEYQIPLGSEGSFLTFTVSRTSLTYLGTGNQGENYVATLGWRSK